jgi:hypothetical protein
MAARRAPWLIVAALLLSGWQYLDSRPQHWDPGVLVEAEPQQWPLDVDVDASADADAEPAAGARPATAPPLRRGDFTATPRARLRAEVRILSRERYRLDPLAEASPIDLAVGWGPMSDSAVIDALDISQSARFYTWRYDDAPPLPVDVISSHSANWHVVPGNREVERRLGRLRAGDVIELEGLLVDLDRDDGGRARTSLTRTDTGAGACEIIWVERLAVRYRD